MVSHPETGSDSPIGSDRDRGRDSTNGYIFVLVKFNDEHFTYKQIPLVIRWKMDLTTDFLV